LQIRPGTYLRVEHLKGALLGQTTASPTNIRLGWKGMQRKTLKLIRNINKLWVKKSFINSGPGRHSRVWC